MQMYNYYCYALTMYEYIWIPILCNILLNEGHILLFDIFTHKKSNVLNQKTILSYYVGTLTWTV